MSFIRNIQNKLSSEIPNHESTRRLLNLSKPELSKSMDRCRCGMCDELRAGGEESKTFRNYFHQCFVFQKLRYCPLHIYKMEKHIVRNIYQMISQLKRTSFLQKLRRSKIQHFVRNR